MYASIGLYSTDPDAANPHYIEPVIAAVDFSSAVEVSRTVGPANWFSINKRFIEGEDVSSPAEDISNVRYTEPDKIAALARDGSVLKVSYAFTKSERLWALSKAITTRIPEDGRGFYLSSAWFNFGPSDIIEFTEDEEGQDDVKLVAVAYFDFVIMCDNYRGHTKFLASSLDSVPEFVGLRDDLQSIVGPLSLQVAS